MSEAFLGRRGGIGKAFAAVSVTYPAGSVCTCTKGSRTLRARDTSGSFLFLIPESGTWTVKSENGTKTAQKSVSITQYGQFESVTLAYRIYLFDGNSGGDVTSVTGGWVRASAYTAEHMNSGARPGGTTTSSRLQVTESAGYKFGVLYTSHAISLQENTTIHATCSVARNCDFLGLCVWNANPSQNDIDATCVALGTIAKSGKVVSMKPSVDISGLRKGNYYIGFHIVSSSSNDGELQVTEVYID